MLTPLPPALIISSIMARKKSPEDLSTGELRRLLLEKRAAERRQRLERFKNNGRVLVVQATPGESALPAQHTVPVEHPGFSTAPQHSARRSKMQRVLLGVEIAALAGFILVLITGLGLLRDLNRESALAMQQPTLTATPLISAVVLPSGHTPPNAPGGAQPNTAEIPEHLRPLVQSLAEIPVPTASPQQAVRIQIPRIQVDHPVVQGDGWEQLKKGVGQHIGTPNPGQDGNIVLSAHNDVFGEIFRHLDQMENGDKVLLFTSQRTYTYIVDSVRIVEPTQVEVMAPTPNPIVTLISCYPYLVDNQRIVVTAHLEAE